VKFHIIQMIFFKFYSIVFYLWAILGHNAIVGRINASTTKSGQMVVLDVLHFLQLDQQGSGQLQFWILFRVQIQHFDGHHGTLVRCGLGEDLGVRTLLNGLHGAAALQMEGDE
jgi:hypothetical protein